MWEYAAVIGDRHEKLNSALPLKFSKSMWTWHCASNSVDSICRNIFILDMVSRHCNWGFYRKKNFPWSQDGKKEKRKEERKKRTFNEYPSDSHCDIQFYILAYFLFKVFDKREYRHSSPPKEEIKSACVWDVQIEYAVWGWSDLLFIREETEQM